MPDVGRTHAPEPRQRWRILFRRDEDARFLAHLDAMKLWERALRRAGIPVARTEGMSPRPRIVFAAPLPLGMLAEREIVDIVLSERLTIADMRRRLERDLPHGFSLVDLHDVWLHAPAVAAQLAGATYRLDVASRAPGPPLRAAEVGEAVAALLAADRLDRERRKEKRIVRYDLRPLIVGIEVLRWDEDGGGGGGAANGGAVAAAGDATRGTVGGGTGTLRVDLRHSQDEGTGRPDEVVAALGDVLGRDLAVTQGVRERLTLVEGAD